MALTRCSSVFNRLHHIYDAESQPVNYFYSDEERVAATPGYAGRFNVFIVVTDLVTDEADIQNIGWNDLEGDADHPPQNDTVIFDGVIYGHTSPLP